MIHLTLSILFLSCIDSKAIQCKLSGNICTISDVRTSKSVLYFHPKAPVNIKVNEVHFENSVIHTLTDELCKAFPTVKKILVENVSMERIMPNALHECRKLTHVSFYANHIRRLHPKIFENNPDLQNINLQFNNLEEISDKMFEPIKQVKTLMLGDNFLVDFSIDQFPKMENLEFLSIYANELIDLDEEELVRKYPNLKKIEINHNHLHCRRSQEITEYLVKNGVKVIDCFQDDTDIFHSFLIIGSGVLLMVVIVLLIVKSVIWWKIRKSLNIRRRNESYKDGDGSNIPLKSIQKDDQD